MKMLNLIRNLFKRKPPTHPIDDLIALTGEQNVSIWNGVNYSGEFMFKDPQDKSGEFGDPKKTPWLRVGFGCYESGYGDWGGGFSKAQDSMVKILVDKNLCIRDVIREIPFPGQSFDKKIEQKLDNLLQFIKPGDKFATANPKLLEWLNNIFAVPEDIRYAHCASLERIFNRSWEQAKWLFEKERY